MIIIISILHHQLFGEQCNYRWKCYLQHLNMSILSFSPCCSLIAAQAFPKKAHMPRMILGFPWYLWRAGWLSGPIKGSSILQITKGAFCRFNTILTNYGVGYGSDKSWQCKNYIIFATIICEIRKGRVAVWLWDSNIGYTRCLVQVWPDCFHVIISMLLIQFGHKHNGSADDDTMTLMGSDITKK